MQEARDKKRERCASIKADWLIAGALTLAGALTRAPYLALVPRFDDEVMQTVYAMSIQPGKFMPLVGNDSYAGPLFSYILAVCLRVFGASPAAPRVITLIMGALTVGLTYWLARALGLRRPGSALAGLLIAANPHHILIASHYAGSTYVLPVFSTAFLAALALAVKRESGGWLVAAGVLLGLAFQATPALALTLPGVIIWLLIQLRPRIGLRSRWPYLAIIAFALGYAPVIIYNVQNQLVGVTIASNRTYALLPAQSLQAYTQNLWHLALQLGRQVSGVLENDESFRASLGLPLLLCAWAVTGLVYAAWRRNSLPALAVGSHMLLMPWTSNYYWETSATRFTNQLTPLICVAMAALAASVWNRVQARLGSSAVALHPATCVLCPASCVLLVALSLWPLVPLFRYCDRAVAEGNSSAPWLAFFDEYARQWRGERVLVSDSAGSFNPPEYFLTVNHTPYTLLPIGRIMERLATRQESGRVVVFMTPEDMSRAGPQADWIAWHPSNVPADLKLDFGAYIIADAAQARKPTFVLTEGIPRPSTLRTTQINLADQLGVIGYEPGAGKLIPGERFIVKVYWKAISAMPEGYVGFVHLIGPDGHLVAQDDHELGRGFYRTLVWQPGEVIRERYEWVMPQDLSSGDYVLRVGAYSFPSLQRLPVRSASAPAQDDVVTLGTLHIGP